MIEFDVETTGLQWYSQEHNLFLVQFYDGVTQPKVMRHPDDRALIQQRLLYPDDYRAWNSKFDLHFLESAGYTLPPESRWHDGMVMAHIIDENRSVALKAVGQRMFGDSAVEPERALHAWILDERKRRRKDAKDTGSEYVPPNYSDVPSEIMDPYAINDVDLQQRICPNYEQAFNHNAELAGVYELERGVMPALYAAERRGIPVDRENAARFETELLGQLEAIEAKCQALGGKANFNPNSSDQVAESLKRRGADLRFVTKSAKSGKLSMDAENLGTVDDELAESVLAFRGTYKLLNTYVKPMLHSSMGDYGVVAPFLDRDDRLHPNFRQVGAMTARMSAAEPNIQNWHRDDLRLRHLVRAEPGHKLVSVDLDAIEMRLFAAFAGEGRMLQTLRAGGDIHTLSAEGVGLQERRRSTGAVESRRQRGKTFNYLVAYGGGVRTMRKTFGVSQSEARQMLDRFKGLYPEIVDLQNTIAIKLQDRGYVKTPWGRHHRVDPRDAYLGVAHLVQGAAADLLKDSLVRIHKAGIPVVACVHDEVVAHVPEADSAEAAETIRELLIDHPRITGVIPLDAEFAIVDRWSHAKDPEYEPTYEKRR